MDTPVFLMKDKGRTQVGSAVLRRVNRNLCYLCKVVITPEHRGKGYYPQLRELAKQTAIMRGYKGWLFTVRPDNSRHYDRVNARFGKPINAALLDQHVAALWWESFQGTRNVQDNHLPNNH